MASTSLTLSPHWDRFIQGEVATGRFASASEVVRAALRELEDKSKRMAPPRANLAEGEQEARHGDEMIRHAALFRLKHASGSAAEAGFLAALGQLGAIPGVGDFQISREVSAKNPYAFAVSMTFADQAAYDAYNAHPLHVDFVQTRWLPEVAEFVEHDSAPL